MSVGPELTWVKQSPDMEKRYGPYVWLRNVTSAYPDQGFRIPYRDYMDRPEILERILFVPDNSRHFKYATRHISDDGVLSLIERLTEIVGVLQEINDTSENWGIRQSWLASVMAELWENRGLFPGTLRVMDYLKFPEGILYASQQIPSKGEAIIKDELFAFLDGSDHLPVGLSPNAQQTRNVRRRWALLSEAQKTLLRDVLPRFSLQIAQIEQIMDDPEGSSIYASYNEILDNPYILSEQYVGEGPDDQVTFNQIDHGMLPSPDLGKGPGVEPDSSERLRALCVEQVRRANLGFLPGV
jgi:hypothetical protein